MGISASKRVNTALSHSPEFNSACDSTFDHCLSLSQHAFQGVLPYQLATAATHLHTILTTITASAHKHPLIVTWVPTPPTKEQVDWALRIVTNHNKSQDSAHEEGELVLGPAQFKEWALVLFAEAVVGNAGKAVLARVPIGAAGIFGVGAVMRGRKEVVGRRSESTRLGCYFCLS